MNQFHVEVQYVSESIALLNMLAKPAPAITNEMNRLAAKYGVQPDDEAKAVVEFLQTIEDAARAEFASDMETIQFYGVSKGDHPNTYLDILLQCKVSDTSDLSVEKYYEKLDSMTPEEYNLGFYEDVFSFGNQVRDDTQKREASAMEVLDAIFDMDVTDAQKLQLQQIFLHYKEHQARVRPLLERAQKLLKKYEKELEKHGRRVVKYFEEELQGVAFGEYVMREYCKDDLDRFRVDCDIYVHYINCAMMGLLFKAENEEAEFRAIGVVGAVFNSSVDFRSLMGNRSALNEEKALAMLKLLGDKSKFGILSSTVKEPAYGAQLAERLGVTTATVSHHTSALLEQDLISLDKVDTKIYYRANPTQIRALIQYLEEHLLPQE